MGLPVTRKLKLIITDCSKKKKTFLAARVGICWIWRMKCVEEGNLLLVCLLVEQMLCDTEL